MFIFFVIFILNKFPLSGYVENGTCLQAFPLYLRKWLQIFYKLEK